MINPDLRLSFRLRFESADAVTSAGGVNIMHQPDISAAIGYLNWRDAQFDAIFRQLRDAFPDLIAQIDHLIDGASIRKLAVARASVGRTVGDVCRGWAEEQVRIAARRSESELQEFRARIADSAALGADAWYDLQAMLPLIGGAGLAVATVGALPTVISFATVSSSVLAVFVTTTVSWPLFAAGAVGIGVTALVSRVLIDRGLGTLRETARANAHRYAEDRVFGLGKASGTPALIDELQDRIAQAAILSMKDAP